jgi:hypothetical protein
MRALALTLGTLAAAAAAGAARAVPAPAPSVTLAARSPVTVRGLHFVAREWVRVTVVADSRMSRRVQAGTTGAFAVRFPDLVLGRCAGLGIRAVGSQGSIAVAKLPLPGCMPARNP